MATNCVRHISDGELLLPNDFSLRGVAMETRRADVGSF